MVKEAKLETGTATRRQFLKGAGGATLGLVAVSGVTGLLASCAKGETPEAAAAPPPPWPYTKLDPEYVRKLGHYGYYNGNCSSGSFYAIVHALQESVGHPYTLVHSDPKNNLMAFGGGGVVGWGQICGALNGTCAALNLTYPEYKDVINELMGWYTNFEFPSDISNNYAVNKQFLVTEYKTSDALPQTSCGSPMCHVSVTTWCTASGFNPESKERSERCARVTGDVAAKAVELLNAHVDNKFTPAFAVPSAVTGCQSCHGPDGSIANVRGAMKQDCVQCHGDPH